MRIQGYRLYIKKLEKKEKENKLINISLCVILFIPSINYFINTFLQSGLSIKLNIITPISYIIMALMSILILYKQMLKSKTNFGIFFFFLFGALLSYFLYPAIRDVIYTTPVDLVYSPINKLIYFCIPSLFGIIATKDYDELFNMMHKFGRIAILMGIVSFCFVVLYKGQTLQYMTYSYFMLLPICVCFEYARVKNTKNDLLLGTIGSICIIMCGARGAVLSLILFLLFQFLFADNNKINFKKLLYFILLACVFIIVLLYFKEIINSIQSILNEMGINSRFISALSEETLLDDSGRFYITNTIVEGIINNPIGYGLYGDRYVTGFFGNGHYRYSHNIITELICDFGIFGGSVIILVLINKIKKIMFKRTYNIRKNIFLILLPYGLIQLLFSSSFLENPAFFMIVGLLFVK